MGGATRRVFVCVTSMHGVVAVLGLARGSVRVGGSVSCIYVVKCTSSAVSTSSCVCALAEVAEPDSLDGGRLASPPHRAVPPRPCSPPLPSFYQCVCVLTGREEA